MLIQTRMDDFFNAEIPEIFHPMGKKAVELADRLQLSLDLGYYDFLRSEYPKVYGQFNHRKTLISISSSHRYKLETMETHLSINIENPESRLFSIKKAGFFHEITRHFDPENVEVLEIGFDEKFDIEAKDEIWMQGMLNQTARKLMLNIWFKTEGAGELSLWPGRFKYVESSALASVERLVNVVHLMDHLANRLQELRFFEKTHGENTEEGSKGEF